MGLLSIHVVPSGYPQSIGGTSTNPYFYILTWSPPIPRERGGTIIRYVINVTDTDNNQTTQYFTSATNLNITGLDPYTTYVCVIAAETSIGIGPFSDEVFIQTLQGTMQIRGAKVANLFFDIFHSISLVITIFTKNTLFPILPLPHSWKIKI